jgi:zinc protease
MFHRTRIAFAAGLALGVVAPSRSNAQALPTDPKLVQGQLDNGLHYVVRRHDIPAGRAVMWIHMHTGSLNETDRQRGLAHYMEHIGFNGSENFKPGSLVPFFESMGMTFGRDQNAFTNYDQTTFQLSLPKADADTLGKGMTFFADVVGRLSLLPAEIDAERQIIQEERRRGLGSRQRIGDYVQERLTPGSLFGFRDAIGTEKTIDGVNVDDFKDYYGKWYCASNATLMVVADADPAAVVKVIQDKFGALPKKPRPVPQDLKVKAYDKSFAIVATDPELKAESLEIVHIEPAHAPTTTEAQLRDDLVLRLGVSAMNQRLGDKATGGDVAWLNARVSSNDEADAIHSAGINAGAKPGKWKETLNEIALELQRGRAFGFSAHELDDVKKEMLSNSERAVETESTQPMSAFIGRLNNGVASGDAMLSPEQRLALLKKHFATITAEQVNQRFAAEFDPAKNVCFVARLPAGAGVPTEAELLELGTKALAVKPTAEAEKTHATALMTTLPKPGKVAEGAPHAATKSWNGWLDNGVNVHFRFMDERKDEVSIRIALIGGEMLETADDRGITSAAQLAWSRPATAHLTSTDIRELMVGKQVNVGGGFGGGRGGRGGGRGFGGGGGGDAISLSVSGSPADLEAGFQLAYLLLTEPKIEAPSFADFQTRTRQGLEESLKNPMALGGRTVTSLTYPASDARLQPTTTAQIDRLTLDAAQKRLEKLVKESPIEVTIVGDVAQEKILDLCAKYLGALPARERVRPDLFAKIRKVERPAGERVAHDVIDTPTKQAFVYSGFYGTDEVKHDDARSLSLAARILSMRMVTEVREKDQLVYSMGAGSRAATTYPGFGTFSASAPTDPSKVDALVAKIASMYALFAKEGPTDDEVAVAKKQFATTWDEQIKEPAFWSGQLSQLTFRGASLDDVMTEPAKVEALTAKQVKETFAKYWGDGKQNSIVVTVQPKSAESKSGS